MLNLVMTISPRFAAISTGMRFGEDAAHDHSIRHRIAWYRIRRDTRSPLSSHSIEQALRERVAGPVGHNQPNPAER